MTRGNWLHRIRNLFSDWLQSVGGSGVTVTRSTRAIRRPDVPEAFFGILRALERDRREGLSDLLKAKEDGIYVSLKINDVFLSMGLPLLNADKVEHYLTRTRRARDATNRGSIKIPMWLWEKKAIKRPDLWRP
jgi:hypothetical protein